MKALTQKFKRVDGALNIFQKALIQKFKGLIPESMQINLQLKNPHEEPESPVPQPKTNGIVSKEIKKPNVNKSVELDKLNLNPSS